MAPQHIEHGENADHNQRINHEQQVHDSQARLDHRNKAERLEWFANQALGAFIHISCDVQLGTVISHNLINANTSYCERYFKELPQTFCPHKFDGPEWARFFGQLACATWS